MTGNQPQAKGFALYRRLLGYVWPYKGIFLISVLGMAIVALAEVAFAALLKPIMDGGFVARDQEIISLTPFLLMGVFVARAIGAIADEYCIAWVSRRVIFDLRELLFARILRLPARYFDLNPTADLISRLIYDLEQVSTASTMAVRVMVKDILLGLGLVVWMFILSWHLTLIFLLVTPLVALVVGKASKRFRRSSKGIQDSMAGITHITKEALQGQKVVKAYGGYAEEESAFLEVNQANQRRSLRRAVVAAVSVPMLLLISGAGVSGIIYLALTDTIGQFVSAGTFVSYMGAILLLMSPIKRLARINEYIQAGIAAAGSVFSLMDEPEEYDSGIDSGRKLSGKLALQDVTFEYPRGQQRALDGVSFAVNPGQTIALVGESGSGKSTVASLLLGFYAPTTGQILLDGNSINTYSKKALREQIALVPQEAILFDGSIEKNVYYGSGHDPDIDTTALLHATGIDLFSATNDGVGELGSRLSGGQRQRVALARALSRKGAMLVLDEATSALDMLSEQAMKAAISQFRGNRSVLLIAHRLSFVTHADQIHVFASGKIIESGTHDRLLAQQGAYAKMWHTQQAQSDEDACYPV
ncbi:MAG: ABC transporter transmembrane domain-containing protein [Arenicellales bacterium]|nr:ABC transporter transmembrane domain-containing protein [Arenicellales bacterium]MDP6791773.1 ABC transporter transmembrane domain-containing protein [Arenicellales bacterium]MDP6918574.1 ABC transporter transmembrane domain-containing protein [Arenicellales bacterium]